MSTAYQLIGAIQEKGVQLWLDGDLLRYDGPIGALSEQDLDELRRQKPSIIEFLKQGTAAHNIPQLVKQSRPEELPLSWAQQRLWFIDQLEGGAAAYHIPGAVRLYGVLDRDALQATLDTIIERHEALRTVFETPLVEPIQVIKSQARFVLKQIDLSALPESEREAEVRRQSAEEAAASFDLSTGPLIRGRLLRLREEEHVWLVTMHHIISDGWSMGVLIREVGVLYAAYREGGANPLPPLPIQYADYAVWQRRWLQAEVLQAQVDYWKEQLTGAPAVLELPLDRPRPMIQSYRGESVGLALDAELSGRLRALSKNHDATLFMTLYAGFAILLSRLSGQEDIVIGIPVANRQRMEVEGLIGFFVNTLALRVRLDDDPSVSALLQRVKELTLGGYARQEVPFEQVVEAVQPARSLSHSPVFQVGLVLQNTPQSELKLPGLRLAPQAPPNSAAQFDLSLMFQESGERIEGVITYAGDLFDRSTVERWVEHLQAVLQGMAQDTNQAVSAIQLLSEQARHQLLEGFNATAAEYPSDKCIQELFEAQVERTPDAIAVVFEEQQLTYGELNRRSNQLARHLRTQGVGPDELVALCVERSVEMVVGLLGILKAGGAYLPLDPNYPAERLEYMLKDAAAKVVLTQEALSDRQWSEVAQQPTTNLDRAELGLLPSHLAYVIYTSGSTGQPKGVMIEHRGICNLVQAQIEAFQIQPDSRVLQHASISFDAAVSEVMTTLCRGASLCLATRDALLPGEPLLQVLNSRKITHATLPPAAVDVLSPVSNRDVLTTLVVAGEACSSSLVKSWAPGRRLINAYGPTETTVCASMYVCDSLEEKNPAIGRPMRNVQIYILDAHGQPVPIGVAGEIHIGGAGVARGYLNREVLTAERFVKNPFSAEPAARMYKTGDLGRWRADGNIEYLGRNDHQVKLRGYRIELGEIEAQLRRHEQVKEAVVLAREDVAGDKRLVAYVTPAQGEVSVEALRTHLENVLPEYMVPSAFVVLERVPLTSNGKVDRKALPAPEGKAHVRVAYEAPQGEIETALAKIWQELLRVERVGRHDNFFELGGNSLLATRIIAHCNRHHLDCTVHQIFELMTIAAIGEQLSGTVKADNYMAIDSSTPGLSLSQASLRFNGENPARALFMVPPAFGGAKAYVELAKKLGPECPVVLLENIEVYSGRPQTIDKLVEYYARVIDTQAPDGPYAVGGWSRGGMIAYAIADFYERRGISLGRLFVVDSGLPRIECEVSVQAVVRQAVGETLGDEEKAYVAAFIDEIQLGNRSRPISARTILFTSTEPSPFDDKSDATAFHRALRIWRAYLLRNGIAFAGGDVELPPLNGFGSMLSDFEVVPVPVAHEQLLAIHALDYIAAKMKIELTDEVGSGSEVQRFTTAVAVPVPG